MLMFENLIMPLFSHQGEGEVYASASYKNITRFTIIKRQGVFQRLPS